MLVSNTGYIYFKSGHRSEKSINELGNSNYKVLIECDNCHSNFETIWSNRVKRIKNGRNDLCSSCSKSGERNSQFGKNRSELLRYVRSHVKNFARQFTDETKNKMSKIRSSLIANGLDIKSNNRGNKAWHESVKSKQKYHSDSSLELMRMMQLDLDINVDSWTKRHGIFIPYIFEGKRKTCVPDFYIKLTNREIILEEVKGRITPIELIKKTAIEEFCKEKGFLFKFTTQKELNINGQYRRFLKTKKL